MEITWKIRQFEVRRISLFVAVESLEFPPEYRYTFLLSAALTLPKDSR
jgi:hypothetical protein